MLAALLPLGACHPQPRSGQPRLHGIQVEARTANGQGPRLRGELLAVSEDSVWVAAESNPDFIHGVPRAGLVVRPRQGGRLRPLRWATLSGLSTGLGLAVACTSHTGDPGCFLLVPVMMSTHYTIAGVALLAMVIDRPDALDTTPESLRRFARFPAGLPPGLRER